MSASTPRPRTERDLRLAKPWIKAISKLNTWVFRLTDGRIGGRFLRGAPVGLLTTTGRRSGRRRTTPLIYLEDGERIVLVASQAGMPRHPLWYRNLEACSEVAFQIGGNVRSLRARRASADEKQTYWPRLCAIYRDYEDYQKRTERDIPVVILEPRPEAP